MRNKSTTDENGISDNSKYIAGYFLYFDHCFGRTYKGYGCIAYLALTMVSSYSSLNHFLLTFLLPLGLLNEGADCLRVLENRIRMAFGVWISCALSCSLDLYP